MHRCNSVTDGFLVSQRFGGSIGLIEERSLIATITDLWLLWVPGQILRKYAVWRHGANMGRFQAYDLLFGATVMEISITRYKSA
jgi:hypothetical protein